MTFAALSSATTKPTLRPAPALDEVSRPAVLLKREGHVCLSADRLFRDAEFDVPPKGRIHGSGRLAFWHLPKSRHWRGHRGRPYGSSCELN